MNKFNPSTYKYTPQLLPRQSKQTGKRFEIGIMYNRGKSIESGKAVFDAAIASFTLTNCRVIGEGNTPQDAADAAIANFDGSMLPVRNDTLTLCEVLETSNKGGEA